MENIKGKIALVTGASRGIGAYIACTLAREGAIVVGVARSKKELEKTQLKIESNGGTAHSVQFDLFRTDSITDLLKQVNNFVSSVDILVNNAGIEFYRYFSDYSYHEIETILKINLFAPMELTRQILPEMLRKNSGHIVNIASLAGRKGVAYNTIYSGSKAGLIMWSDGLRQELFGTEVNVSTIQPGYISEAGMFHDSGVEAPVLLGTSKPQKVADAVVKAIKKNKSEVIVNKGPIKPLLAINGFSPSLGDKIVRKFGVVDISHKRVE